MTASYIYFIQAGEGGPIKVGFTSMKPERRISHIQTGCPWPIKVIGLIEGDAADEKRIHKQLAPYKTKGEWFSPVAEVLRAVEMALTSGKRFEIALKSKMNSLRHIRKTVFGVTQADLASIARVSQGTVSKWERENLKPNLEELERIRSEAVKRGLEWNDSWFFEQEGRAQ